MATKKVSAKTAAAETKATLEAVETVVTPKTTKKAKAAPAVEKAAVKAVSKVKVTFELPVEAVQNAGTVAVLSDFKNWEEGALLKKQKDGSFKATLELEKGRSYEYRFLINGEKWENAWNAESYKPTPFGTYNSVVTA
ncbi:MAG: isoamylase early set domain-containing protein [Bacteroidota bacterium]